MDTAAARMDIDDSSGKRPRVAIRVIAGCVVVLVLAEAGAIAISRISRIERRTTEELAAAVRMRGGGGDGVERVLMAGNSLLLEGVDFSVLRRELGPGIELSRLVVENTAYLDWYYGLRNLLASGSRPDAVVLTLSNNQWISNGIRGDYSANRLFAAGDLPGAARDAAYSLTPATSLWLAHYSTFFGTRAEIRKWLLSSLMPGMRELQPHLAGFKRPPAPEQEIRRKLPGRLEALRRLTADYGARFALLVPATLSEGPETLALVDAARQASVQVLEPVAPGAIPETAFTDGFHLNAAGARVYTQALAPVLKRAAENPAPRRQ